MPHRVNMQWRTPIVEVMNPDHARLKAGLVRHAYEIERRAKGPIASGVAPLAKSGLYESPFDLFATADVPEVGSLRAFCAQSVAEIVVGLHQQANGGRNVLGAVAVHIVEAWMHITRDGGYHDVHTHPGFSWCGIYYVQSGESTADPPNGVNRFYPPWDVGYQDVGSTVYQPEVFQPAAVDGKLILFPGYVRHSAVPYRGPTDRILVAFNARASKGQG